jgi:lysophospholipase L1-like esterase
MGWIRSLGPLLLLVLALPAAGGERVVLAVGDSLMADPAGIPSFVERLEIPGTRLVNLACAGASSGDWVRRARPGPAPCFEAGAAQRLEPWRGAAAVVVVLIGTNDSYGFREPGVTPPSLYRRNLERLVARFRAPVVLSVPPPTAVSLPMLERYRAEIARVVADHDHVFAGVDFLAELPVGRLRDGVHPDAEGHARMAELLRPRVVERLPPVVAP